MSSRYGVLLIWSTFAACVVVGVASSWWSGLVNFWCVRCVVGGSVWIWRLAELRSLIRRLSCLLSEFVRGVRRLSGSVGGMGRTFGQVVWASSWYASSTAIMWSAALPTLVGVILGEFGLGQSTALFWDAVCARSPLHTGTRAMRGRAAP